MGGKKAALVVALVAMMVVGSVAQFMISSIDNDSSMEENEGSDELLLLSDGKDGVAVAEYLKGGPRKMMKGTQPSCRGDFCGVGLLPCDTGCYCFITTGQSVGSCVLD